MIDRLTTKAPLMQPTFQIPPKMNRPNLAKISVKLQSERYPFYSGDSVSVWETPGLSGRVGL